MKFAANDAPAFHAQVAARPVDGQVLVVLADAGEVLVLNETAACVWQGIERHQTIAELAAGLAETYSLPLAQAAEDVDAFLAELVAAQVVVL